MNQSADACLILRGLRLDVIDHQHFHGALGLFQLQPKLFRYCVRKRERAVWAGRGICDFSRWSVSAPAAALELTGGAEAEREIP